VEAGAYDGEIFSNSLYFEVKRGWTGVSLIKHFLFFANDSENRREFFPLEICSMIV
jgi:hypothetical protein